MSQRYPNLFLVGAMRAGTTALHESLAAHPDIFMSGVKEPAFFADPVELATDSRVASEAGFAGNEAAYLSLFAGADAMQYAGESSTHYTKLPRISGVAERIAAASPDARILYVIRDPVERTISHYRYSVRAKYERRTPLDALRNEPIYCAVSDYAMQITPFIDSFGEDRVHIAVLEELSTGEPGLDAVLEWLDLAPDAAVTAAYGQRNQVTGAVSRARGPELLHRLGRTSWYQRIARAVIPSGLRSRIRRSLNEPVTSDDVRSTEVVEFLRHTHEPHAAAIEDLLGRRMGAWTTLRPQ